jgi:hypothetical protein
VWVWAGSPASPVLWRSLGSLGRCNLVEVVSHLLYPRLLVAVGWYSGDGLNSKS